MESRITPAKRELARYKALSDVGLTANAVAVRLGRDPKTVRKYLRSDVYKDPGITAMVDTIKRKELAYLYFLGAKPRKQPRERLDKRYIANGNAPRSTFRS